MENKSKTPIIPTERPSNHTRRKILAGLTAGTGGLLAASLAGNSQAADDETQCLADDAGREASRFPQHALVFDHRGRKLRFYNDLIKNKVVMIQFMSTELDGDYQTAKNLAVMQGLLGDRLGRDVHLISATVEPERDGVEVLAAYAQQHNAGDGWSFITGTPATMQSIKDALFFRPGGHAGHEGHDLQDCSMGLIRYGNDAAGLWGSVPTRTDPRWLAERLNWITPKNTIASTSTRGGPPVRDA